MRVNNSVQTRSPSRENYRFNDLGGGHCYAIHTKDKAVTVIHLSAGLQLNFDGVPPRSRSSPDGGWGWMVAAGTTLTVAFVPSLLLCSGILLAEVCQVWQEKSLFAASWVPAIMYSMWNFAGPLSTVLLTVYSCRVVTLIGGILLSLGLILSFFVTQLEVFYVTYGILGGIGAGLSLYPGPVLLNHYFGRRVGAANVMCLVVGSVIQLGMPSLLYSLLHRYLFRGTVLILGALAMHMLVAAMLYRPRGKDKRGLQPHQRRYKSLNSNSSTKKKNKTKKKKKKKRRKSSADGENTPRNWQNPSENLVIPPRRRTRTISTDSFRMLPDIPEEQEPIGEEGEQDLDSNGEEMISVMTPLQANDTINRSRSGSTISLPQQHVMNPPLRTKQRSYSLNALGLSPSTKPSEADDDDPHATAIGIFGNPLDVSIKRTGSLLCTAQNLLWDGPKRLLVDPIWLILSLSIALFMLVFPNVLLYLPLQALHLRMKTKHVAALLSFGVFSDLGGRVFMPWLSKKWRLKPKFLYGIMEIISTFTLFGFANEEATFFLLAVCSILFGLASGAGVVVVSPMVYEYLGADKLPAALMFSRMLQGVLFLIGAPAIGYFASSVSLNRVFYLLITLQMCSVVFWCIHLVTNHCRKSCKETNTDVPVTEL